MIMKNTIIRIVLIIFFSILIIYGGYNCIKWYKDIKRNDTVREKVINKKVVPEDVYKDDIDFKTLKNQNSDTVAYIEVKNTNIKNVVVKGTDNDYYLTHNFLKEENIAGWLFADYRNKFDGTDKNIIIYGHNMMEGSNFGSLKNTMNSDWYTNKDNLLISLITDKDKMKYKVFSIYKKEAEDYYIQTSFIDDKEYLEFLNVLSSRSIYKFDTELDNSSILTLSTCGENDNERVVLHAIKIN